MGFLFFIIFVSLAAVIFFSLRSSSGSLVVAPNDELSLNNLKKRYANGEITKKEFEVLKKYLKD